MNEQPFWETDPVLSALEPRAALSRETEELVKRAKSDKGAPFERKAIEALAELKTAKPAEYQRARDRLKEAGIKVGDLDQELKKLARANSGDDARDDHGQGRPLKLLEPEPWPEPVDGAALLDEIAKAFRTHVALPDRADVALPLWAAHTYLMDLWDHTPRLGVTNPEKRCGKTTLLIVLGFLVWRLLPASNTTAAATFRAIDQAQPTLLIDGICCVGWL